MDEATTWSQPRAVLGMSHRVPEGGSQRHSSPLRVAICTSGDSWYLTPCRKGSVPDRNGREETMRNRELVGFSSIRREPQAEAWSA